ncbi:MAG TPA: peroxide stress protein YaaA [Candidatus Ruthenibacterium merdavium]|uniref:UPF0246 protein H9698_06675 n=1 Tax=Candidatus Ruthenibacterium merdavium TaxID=2838752 RepID=A0A9D2TKJ0_9FIRM|nr:peroxide stress protein YaaA [Candidatus Ruthenibacterium merdavium]
MKMIISPAKKMVVDTDSFPCETTPVFLQETQQLAQVLKGMSYEALKRLWRCNDAIAEQNVERLETMDLQRSLTPAVLAYDGIQYRHLAPEVFTHQELSYVQEHLRILSGFYGILRPLDGVVPYRLEMQAKFSVNGHKDLYDFWGSQIAKEIFSETDCVVNLASKEYSVCISKYLPKHVSFITCMFAEEIGGKLIEKGTKCKMARGEMVRYAAENGITHPQALQHFQAMNFRYSPTYSNEKLYVFVQQPY